MRSGEAGPEMAEEAKAPAPVEEAEIQDLAVHAGPGREAQTAPVGGGVGDDGERGAVLSLFHLREKAPRPPVDELPEPRHPVRRLAGQALEPRAHGADEDRIQAYARHQEEVARARAPHGHATGASRGDHVSHPIEVPGQAQLSGQDVGRAAGPHGERDRTPDERLHRLVHGAVPAVDHDRLRAGLDRLLAEARGVPGRRGLMSLRADAALPEQLEHRGYRPAPIAATPGTGVGDDGHAPHRAPFASQSEGASTTASEASPKDRVAPAKPALEPRPRHSSPTGR